MASKIATIIIIRSVLEHQLKSKKYIFQQNEWITWEKTIINSSVHTQNQSEQFAISLYHNIIYYYYYLYLNKPNTCHYYYFNQFLYCTQQCIGYLQNIFLVFFIQITSKTIQTINHEKENASIQLFISDT